MSFLMNNDLMTLIAIWCPICMIRFAPVMLPKLVKKIRRTLLMSDNDTQDDL